MNAAMGVATSYDDVIYPGDPYPQTHPDRLATIASLFGMHPAPPSRCRVLELGCGDGGNLMPMAYQYPASEFVGIDLSSVTVERGKAAIAALGLANITLRTCDIMQVDAQFGEFDYIIAHGVYSWVPPVVRTKMLTIFRDRLAPQGVAYFSFNAYPGSHRRDLARRMMLYHVRSLADPDAQVREGRALLRLLAEATDADTLYGAVMRDLSERAQKRADPAVYHDDLNAGASAFLLHQVVEAAAREGLQYLCEAFFPQSTFGAPAEHTRALLSQIPEDQVILREQYFDFLVGRWFRQSLWCHADVELNRVIDPGRVKALHVSADARPTVADPDLRGLEAVQFGTNDQIISLDQPLAKAAFVHLGRIWPQACAFSALLENAARMISDGGGGDSLADQGNALAALIYHAYRGDRVELHVEAPPLATMPGERPEASRIVRWQIEAGGPHVTNLRHTEMDFSDEVARRLLLLIDGTRTIDELAVELERLLGPGNAGDRSRRGSVSTAMDGPGQSRALVVQALQVLARNALLVG
jgi:methyltransferase-like protein